MATVSLSSAFDFANPPPWTVFTASGGSTFLYISDGSKAQTFYGALTYTGTTSNPQVHGTVNRIDMAVNSFVTYDISGLNLDAARLQQLVVTPGGGPAFYAYVLAGNDSFNGTAGGRVLGYAGNDTIGGASLSGSFDGGDGIDTFRAYANAAVSADLGSGVVSSPDLSTETQLRLVSVENLIGSDLGDTLAGSAGDNVIDGGAGDDTVSYARATLAVQVDLTAGTGRGAGNDSLLRIENAIGGAGADLLVGNGLANRLDGGAGSDTMRGGLGNDTYVLSGAGDVIVEAAGGGRDTVVASASLTLGAELENLQLAGSAALNGTGNGLANQITGNAGANRLSGAGGNDTLRGGSGADTLDGGTGADQFDGGTGNDQYLVADALDVVGADAGGTDTVIASVSYALGNVAIENLSLTGTALNGTGNVYANRIVGTAAANQLDGRAGADTLEGGAGNDTYLVDHVGDRIVEYAAGGADRVRASVSHVLAINVENLQLTGSAAIDGTGNTLANQIVGNAGANVLNGGAGADTLTGGLGNDTYVVAQADDVLIEATTGGVDLVRSSVNWTLGANLEDLLLTGTALQGTGNALANRLGGNGGNNRLDGGAGADTLTGGQGNDTYVVDSAGDRIVETVDAGNDVVYSAVSWVLGAYLEQLRLTGSAAIDATGNAADNVIVGNTGANRLDGGDGFDSLYGGAGDDTYVVGIGDQVTEAANAGTDTVMSTTDIVLSANVENGVLLGGIFGSFATGNALANTLTGNAGDNLLDGGSGADTMKGGGGADTYVVDNLGDLVIDAGGTGGDVVRSQISITSLWSGVEDVVLLGSANLNANGNAAGNVLTGNTGANRLDGGAGADTMRGGAGNDTYVVDSVDDYLQEDLGAGTDRVLSSASVDGGWSGVEFITLTGSANLSVVCRVSNVTIAGNAGDNRLDGIGGNNTVSYANATGAVHVDLDAGTATGFGTDQVLNFRGLVGSGFDDTLRGSFDANVLTGGAGSDRFELWNGTADTVLDFVSGTDLVAIDQSGLAIGNGDLVIDGATDVVAAGSFGPAAELVTGFGFTGAATDTALAATAIGSASAAYADGQSALFAVKADEGVALYRFVSAGSDATVDAAELSLVGVLSGSTVVTAADFAWIA